MVNQYLSGAYADSVSMSGIRPCKKPSPQCHLSDDEHDDMDLPSSDNIVVRTMAPSSAQSNTQFPTPTASKNASALSIECPANAYLGVVKCTKRWPEGTKAKVVKRHVMTFHPAAELSGTDACDCSKQRRPHVAIAC